MENKPLQQRKLAAILFADIVGYTALMQTDEQQALSHLQKFKNALKQLVPSNKGEIIQFYGDGCLATFHSSLDAVACAKKLQAQFQTTPTVPVRIGLHSGDVVFKEGNVFGDAVNITSRIESMGVPGAVLLSNRIREHIKNKPGFSFAELGVYEFKNIEEPMVIYALTGGDLVVPKKKDIKGKLKVNTDKKGRRSYLYLALLVGLLPLIGFLLYHSHGQYLSGHTHQVEMINEDGTKEMRHVPKAEFTRKLVSFPLKNELEDEKLDWLSVGVPLLFIDDIEQDMRLFASSPFALKSEYAHYNQEYPKVIPFSTEVKIAQDFYTDYFVTGAIQKGTNTAYAIQLQIYDTKSGKVFQDLKEEGDDIYDIVDRLSASFRDNQFLPDAESSNTPVLDLPVRSLVSSNLNALEQFVKGILLINSDVQQLEQSINVMERSTQLDPNCADCFSALGRMQFFDGKIDAANQSTEKASLLAESLPERKRLAIRSNQLQIDQDINGLTRLYENWRKLYPDDLTPYSRLLSLYSSFNEHDKAKAVGKAAIERGHGGTIMTDLASIHIQTGEYEVAENLLKEFAKLYPHKANKTTEIADIYIAQGKLDKALDFYETLNLLGNSYPSNAIGLSDVQARLGKFDAAQKTLTNFLPKAKTGNDSLTIYVQLEQLYHQLGRYDDFYDTYQKRGVLFNRTAPPLLKINYLLSQLDVFIDFNQNKIVNQNLSKAENTNEELKSLVHCMGNFIVGLSTDDAERLEGVLQESGCKEVLQRTSGEHVEHIMTGHIHRCKGEYQEAEEQFRLYMEKSGTPEQGFDEEFIDIYLKTKEYQKGIELTDKLLLSNPNNPVALTASAKFKEAKGDTEEAKELIQKALSIWANADKEYIYYQEALAFEKEL